MSIQDYITQAEVTDFAARIVRIPSESKLEKDVAEAIRREMETLGYDEVLMDDMYNVVGTIKGTGGGKSLMLNGHIDHAEPGAMEEPFSGKIIDGAKYGEDEEVLYGRAAVDMKGAIAAMVYAGAAVIRSGERLKGDLIVACNPREEESAAEGVLYMLDHDDIKADMSICGEATNMTVYLGHRGNAEVEVKVEGVMAHGSNPSNGINAAEKACALVGYVMENYDLPSDPLLGDCTKTVLDIKADTARKAPVVPDVCYIWFDRRFLPGETKEQILGEFEKLITEASTVIPDLKASCKITKWGIELYTPPEELVVKAVSEARKRILGEEGPKSAWIFGTDGAFVADRGIPTVGFGPGNEIYAHTPDDHIPLSHLENAARIYAETAVIVCNEDK